MTEQKAMIRLDFIRCALLGGTKPEIIQNEDNVELMDNAIKALEDVQQYRAIGTVEGYERAIESSIENYNLYREYKAKVQEYRTIGTVEECRAAVEKQKPMKPLEFDGHWYKCPKCGKYAGGLKGNYCHSCGQAIDWSDTNDKFD